jgi:general secretion pathway protein G
MRLSLYWKHDQAPEQSPRHHNFTKAHAGFTFIEIIMVMGILMGLMAFIIPQVVNQQKRARINETILTLRMLQQAIEGYKTDTSVYPGTLNDLITKPADVKGWAAAYIPQKKVPQDPWGAKFKYEVTPDAEHPYELYSYGPDGRKTARNDWLSVWDEK